jgi:hypothetical protein
MSVATVDIKKQSDSESGCAFYAIQNLYVWAGLTPPPIDDIARMANQLYTTEPSTLGISIVEAMALLGLLEFPLILALAVIPRDLSAREVFPMFLDQDCGLFMVYDFHVNGKRYGHAVVAETWSEQGVKVICSSDPKNQDGVLSWEYEGPEMPDTSLPHGNKNTIPWRTQGYSTLMSTTDETNRIGICRAFIVAWPSSRAALP